MKRSPCLALLALLAVPFAAARAEAAAKKTVCAITINSSDERETFRQALDPNEFDFVELTDPASYVKDPAIHGKWFDQACQSKVRCDVIVLSGHFAGHFFGSSGKTLSLEELEDHSCAKDCEGVLSHAKETFLFGCNTLASHVADHRTIQDYIKVLTDDGMSQREAEQIANGRYGAFGQENRDKMRRSFVNVPYLYGFASTSPLGAEGGPMLRKYLADAGDYSAHLDEIASHPSWNADTHPNAAIANAIHHVVVYKSTGKKEESFTQTSGLTAQDPAYAQHENICRLFDRAKPLVERFPIVDRMIHSDSPLTYLPSVMEFIALNIGRLKYFERDLLARLRNDVPLRDQILGALDKLPLPTIRMDWVSFAYSVGWTDAAPVTKAADDVYADFLRLPVNDVRATAACTLAIPVGVKLDPNEIAAAITAAHLESPSALRILACGGLIAAPKVQALVLDALRAGPSEALLRLLDHPSLRANPSDLTRSLGDAVKATCVPMVLAISSLRNACLHAMAGLGLGDEAAVATARGAIDSPDLSVDSALAAMRILTAGRASLDAGRLGSALGTLAAQNPIPADQWATLGAFLALPSAVPADAVAAIYAKPLALPSDRATADGYLGALANPTIGVVLADRADLVRNACFVVRTFSRNALRFIYPDRRTLSCFDLIAKWGVRSEVLTAVAVESVQAESLDESAATRAYLAGAKLSADQRAALVRWIGTWKSPAQRALAATALGG